MTTIPIHPPFASRPRQAPVTTVVLHATAGSSLLGAISALRQTGRLRPRGLGYHYLIDKDGKVYKGCATGLETFHCGLSKGPDGPFVNRYSVGISLVNLNDGHDPYTQPQLDSVIELLRELKAAIPTLRWLTAHYVISPGRKTDPRGYPVHEAAAASGLEWWG